MHTIPQVLNPPGEPIDCALLPPCVIRVGPPFAVRCLAGEGRVLKGEMTA